MIIASDHVKNLLNSPCCKILIERQSVLIQRKKQIKYSYNFNIKYLKQYYDKQYTKE
jgi:hypothetical protein